MKSEILALADLAETIKTDFGDGEMTWRKWTCSQSDQPPVLLFHGGFGSWTHWIKTIPDLMLSTTVIAADLPGLGDSDDVARPHTVEKLSDILVQGIDEVLDTNQSFHLVGFSFGGLLASHVAATFGDQCLSFTAVGASGFGDLHYRVDGIKRPDVDMTDEEAQQVHRNNLQILMFAEPSTTDDLSLYIHRTNVARGRIKSRSMSLSDELCRALPDIKARVGGIWGELDATGGGIAAIRERQEILQNHQPHAAFDVIDGAGHWVMYEAPEAFNLTLRKHLNLPEIQG